MRTKKEFIRISVNKDVYNRIKDDKKHFQESIGGGKWSISDTITEYFKIIKIRDEMIKNEDENREYCNYCQME